LTAYVRCFDTIARSVSSQVMRRATDPELEALLESLSDALSRMSGERRVH